MDMHKPVFIKPAIHDTYPIPHPYCYYEKQDNNFIITEHEGLTGEVFRVFTRDDPDFLKLEAMCGDEKLKAEAIERSKSLHIGEFVVAESPNLIAKKVGETRIFGINGERIDIPVVEIQKTGITVTNKKPRAIATARKGKDPLATLHANKGLKPFQRRKKWQV